MKKTLRIVLALCLVFIMLLGAVTAYAASPTKDSQGRYNVTQFGANGKDTKSDRQAIQTALDLAKSSSTTVKVYIPAGTYYLEDYLTIYSNTELIMETTTTLKPSSSTINAFIRRAFVENTKKDYSSIQNVTISGGVFDGTALKSEDTEFIYIDHGQNITLKGCVFQNIYGRHAIQLDGVKNVTCSNLTFKDCTRYSNYGDEDSRRTSEALHIDHISTDGVSAAGARPNNDGVTSNNILVENCKFINCNAGVGCHWADNISRGSGFTVKGCTFTNVKYNPINIAAYNNVNITGNTADDASCFITARKAAGTIAGNTIGKTHTLTNGSQGYGILVYGCKNTSTNQLVIKNNTLKNCAAAAIDTATDEDICSYITIQGNTISAPKSYGILCIDGSNIKITGNKVTNSADTSISCSGISTLTIQSNTVTGSKNYSIMVKSNGTKACNNVTVSENTVKNSAKTGISCSDVKKLTVSKNTVSDTGNNLDIFCKNCTGKAEGNKVGYIGQASDSFTISEGSSSGGSTTPTKAGWKQSGTKWWYQNADGTYPKSTWKQIEGSWYYFDKSGYALTGWQKIGSSWYYFNARGVMQTGWMKSGSSWYYFNSSGAMLTGWQKIGKSWYYFNSGGAMQTGWMQSGKSWYYFNSSGVMLTGWQKIGTSWYYFNSGGAMQTGWMKSGSSWYYFKSSGVMAANETVNGYTFDANGVWIK